MRSASVIHYDIVRFDRGKRHRPDNGSTYPECRNSIRGRKSGCGASATLLNGRARLKAAVPNGGGAGCCQLRRSQTGQSRPTDAAQETTEMTLGCHAGSSICRREDLIEWR